MVINSLKWNKKKCYLSITFLDEIEERIFLQKILSRFEKLLPVNCMLTDLDTAYSTYERYFEKDNYYVFDRLTTVSVFAFDLAATEIEEVISNWGYYTIDAVFALGKVDDELKKHKIDGTGTFKSLPVVISQVLDISIDIAIDQCYFEEISQLFVVN